MSRLATALAVVLGTHAVAQTVPSSSLETWPGITLPEGSVSAISDQSLTVRPHDPSDPIRTLGWHQVRTIPDAIAGEHRDSAEAGRAIWRAGIRLDRGDWPGAAALLSPLEDRYRDAPGPTSTAYFRALLRSRLAQLDRAAAAEAWLALREVSDAPPAPHPQLIPLYETRPTGNELATDPSEDPIAESHAIAIGASTLEPGTVMARADRLFNAVGRDDLDARLHAAVVGADLGSPETREAAREELRQFAESDDSFRGTWARLAIARSLSREPDDLSRRLSIAAFVEVSIRDQGVAPLLAGLALAEAAVAAQRISDPQSAQTLAAEFRERFPGHPAIATLPGALDRARPSTTSETDP